jgi:hypothetical protein
MRVRSLEEWRRGETADEDVIVPCDLIAMAELAEEDAVEIGTTVRPVPVAGDGDVAVDFFCTPCLDRFLISKSSHYFAITHQHCEMEFDLFVCWVAETKMSHPPRKP